MASVVYIVRISKNQVKIGFSTNFDARLRSFRASSLVVEPMLLIPGDRSLERRLHNLFGESRVRNEIFERDYRMETFISLAERESLATALEYLEQSTPKLRAQRKLEERRARILERRKTKAEMDAYCASLVAERKQRLGW